MDAAGRNYHGPARGKILIATESGTDSTRVLLMTEEKNYPYVNRMNVQFGSLEIVHEKKISDSCTYKWFNQTLCQVNDTWIRLGVCQGEYHWHQHADTDEFFYGAQSCFSSSPAE